MYSSPIELFRTNSSGLIYVLIPNDNLTIGKNFLIFKVLENIYHYNATHEYQLKIIAQTDSSNSDKDNSNDKENSDLISPVISVISILSVVFLFFVYAYLKKQKVPIPSKKIPT